MSIAAFRRIVLSMPDAVEGSHMGHPDFRVGSDGLGGKRGRIFASLFQRKGVDWGMVKLPPDVQWELIHDYPQLFQPASGAWGRQGCTLVRLPFGGRAGKGETTIVRRAVRAAWKAHSRTRKGSTR